MKENIPMMMTRTYKEHSKIWQPSAAIYVVVCSLGQTLSATNIFGGKLGQEMPRDSRYIRH
jgi:hypothetical protein